MNSALDAALVASLFAVDPHGVGGVCMRSPHQPPRDQWLQMIRSLLPLEAPLRRVPFNISDDRLLGGLDLVATLRANRAIADRGVLAVADGGAVILSMAERLTAHTAACINAVLDTGVVTITRDGVSIHDPARVGIIALDEGIDDECAPTCLIDRVAFLLDFTMFAARTELLALHDRSEILSARRLLPQVSSTTVVLEALCAAALALGAGSPRVSVLAERVARINAALDGRTHTIDDDAAIAARLVLAPRASIAPAVPGESEETRENQADDVPPQAPPQSLADASLEHADSAIGENNELQERVIAAAQAAIPSGLLARLRSSAALGRTNRGDSGGRVGALRKGGRRGRPSGVRSAPPGASRLNVIATLRAAAPWQRLRGRDPASDARVRIHPEDFRVVRYKQRSQTLTIFAVDASGSAALNRLAETKGAVELLLADCYIRRDQVAVIAFRGLEAQILLPPTRSLVRAKRSLAGLPGGGGTPLAAAIDSAVLLALAARRRGETPTVVMLTDGRGNVARDGATGREVGQADASAAARALRAANIATLFIDTSPRPQATAQQLARAMDAHYIPLPFANARSLSKIVMAATDRGT
jgi:magnesium chelatase subunit D